MGELSALSQARVDEVVLAYERLDPQEQEAFRIALMGGEHGVRLMHGPTCEGCVQVGRVLAGTARVVHRHPDRGSDRVPCCGFRLSNLGPGALSTNDPQAVTCRGA